MLSESQVEEVIRKIEQGRLTPSLKTNAEHIKYVKNSVAKKQNSNAPICPKCSGAMVLRKVKKGKRIGSKFWGCKKYPQCRGVMNLR